jgi:O-methyltransferase domain
VIFDQPGVVAGAQPRLEAAGVADRCRLVGGDFLESVPTGGDAYTLISVLHNWDDERAVAILSSCRQAVRDDARLLVCEWVIPPGNGPSLGKLLDLQMLVLFGGRTRTLPEFTSMFAEAGFAVTRLVGTRAGISIVEGTPR